MKKLRVAHIITGLAMGGAEGMLYKLLQRSDQHVFSQAVISLSAHHTRLVEPIRSLGVPVQVAGIEHLCSFSRFNGLLKWLRCWKPDVLQGWMYHGNMAAAFLKMFLPARTTVYFGIRDSIYDIQALKWPTRAVIYAGARWSTRAVKIVYNSTVSARQHARIGYDPNRTIVLPNGFDPNVFQPDPTARLLIRSQLGLTPDAFLIGLAARYDPKKDHATFLRAAAMLSNRSANAHFVLVGTGIDNDNHKLRRQINDLGLSGKVHLLGERMDMAVVTAAFDIANCCSRWEGFANVIGEAMSCGVLCVVTDVGDSARIVADTGRVVPVGCPRSLAAAWQECHDMGREHRVLLGEAARRRVVEHYDLSIIAARFQNLWRTGAATAA